MTREEAIAIIRQEYLCVDRNCDIERNCGKCDLAMPSKEPILEAYKMAIKALKQLPDIKDVYDKGYKDGQKALAVHLELCKEEGNCDYYDSYNQTCRRSDVPKEPCEDCISREEVCDYIAEFVNHEYATDREHEMVENIIGGIQHLPSVQPKPKTGHCKDCKFFEYDSVAKVDGIPLIVAHEICKKWGDGCKTSENGYCFLFEPQESEEQE